jgi:tetratricopeptide (TPR) repeat protein
MAAAEKAERREGIREADRYYARALELVGEEHSGLSLELRLARARTLDILGDFEGAEELLTAVAEEARAAGRSELLARALIRSSNIATKLGRSAEARGFVAEATEIAANLDDPILRIGALVESSNIHSWIDGDLDRAVVEVCEALALAEELGDHAQQVEGHIRLVGLHYNLGNLREAEECVERCAALLGEEGSLRQEARLTFQRGITKYHLGEIDEAERLGLQAQEWLERTGERYIDLQNRRTLALCALARSDSALAEARLREALPLAASLGGWVVVEINRCLVDALIRQSRLSEARQLADAALGVLPEQDGYARAAGLLIEANLSTAVGRHDEACGCFDEAIRLLQHQRLPLDLGEARFAYGRALRDLGDAAGAAAKFEEARAELEPLGARGIVTEIDRELAALAQGAGQAGPSARS